MIMSFWTTEGSEESRRVAAETLRYAQGDISFITSKLDTPVFSIYILGFVCDYTFYKHASYPF